MEFAYTGKLVFTTDNFERLTKAIKELKVKNIDQESIDKIREDIEVSRVKKAQALKAQVTPIHTVQVQAVQPQQIVQVVTSPPPRSATKTIVSKNSKNLDG